MADRQRRTILPWVVFGGCVLVVAVLDWAEPVLLPAALAMLLTFLLNPPVTALQRSIGRPAAVILVVSLTLCALTALTWGLTRQISGLAAELPAYRQNIKQRVADIRNASRGGTVEKVQSTLEDIKSEMAKGDTSRPRPAPVVIVPDSATGVTLPVWITALVEPLATAALVTVLVVFMLLEHRDMRDRLVGLIGQGHLATTTRALEEAGTRVSRYLLMQSMVNVIYGGLVGLGTWLLGVPYPLLWAACGAALRFVPYLGPWIAAAGPVLVTLAAQSGWTQPIYVTGFFIALELFTNLVLETVLYAGAAGVTQVALLIAVAFWTWLWGPLGLLLSTPLTVCLVVIGKHVPGLRFISTLIADEPALGPDAMFYQRLLSRDKADAWEVLAAQVKHRRPEEIYDAVLIPALGYAERDRISGDLTAEEERELGAIVLDLVGQLEASAGSPPEAGGPAVPMAAPGEDRLRILGYPMESASDEVALRMLSRLLGGIPVELDVMSPQTLVGEMIATVRDEGVNIVCLADLPPSAADRVRSTVKRLRQAAPDVTIVVGRWGPPDLNDEPIDSLLEAGASHVSRSLAQARNQIRELAASILPPTSEWIPEPEPVRASPRG